MNPVDSIWTTSLKLMSNINPFFGCRTSPLAKQTHSRIFKCYTHSTSLLFSYSQVYFRFILREIFIWFTLEISVKNSNLERCTSNITCLRTELLHMLINSPLFRCNWREEHLLLTTLLCIAPCQQSSIIVESGVHVP